MKNYGVLTLATENDYNKAIGLALSLRISNPGVKTAVACSLTVGEKVAPYFDYVIPERREVKGFAHKVYLDEYTPFETTFFFDSDVLIFKDLTPFVEKWRHQSYVACGHYRQDGISCFGLDRAAILQKIGYEKLVVIDGAGHALFDKRRANSIFEHARSITKDYSSFAPGARYADEDVMNIVMTMAGLAPADGWGFFCRLLSAKRGTLNMDARIGLCEFVEVANGLECAPTMMHFAADEGYVRYTFELYRLFKKYNVSTQSLWINAIEDGMRRDLRPRVKMVLQSIGMFR